jgi:hypothetical protein
MNKKLTPTADPNGLVCNWPSHSEAMRFSLAGIGSSAWKIGRLVILAVVEHPPLTAARSGRTHLTYRIVILC